MLLAVDVGNTNIVFAVFDGDRIVGKWRLSTDTRRTADEHAIILKEFMELKNISFPMITDVIISSVVPQNLFELTTMCREYFSCEPILVNNKNINIKIAMDKPEEVGADRLVNAFAAYNIYKTAAIIIDFGTATTFDVVEREGTYSGGMIAPGVNLSLDALHKAAAKLPDIAIKKPKQVIGKSTISAMQAGIYFGYVGLIDGIISKIKDEYPYDMVTIATGGLAPLFASATNSIDHLESDLTIHGLNEIFRAFSI